MIGSVQHLEYSISDGINKISKDKLQMGEFTGKDEMTMYDITLLKRDYFSLLEVLELVIAY